MEDKHYNRIEEGEKIKAAQDRKEQIELGKLKMNMFLIHKWDIIREKVFSFVPVKLIFREPRLLKHVTSSL